MNRYVYCRGEHDMHKTLIIHINVDINIVEDAIYSSAELLPWFQSFADDIKQVAADIGYTVPNVEPVTSRINGGVSKYYTFLVQTEDVTVKAGVNIRFSNHTSKVSEEQRRSLARKNANLSEIITIDPIDVVQPDVDYVHISIDGTVVRDKDVALQILARKLQSSYDKGMLL